MAAQSSRRDLGCLSRAARRVARVRILYDAQVEYRRTYFDDAEYARLVAGACTIGASTVVFMWNVVAGVVAVIVALSVVLSIYLRGRRCRKAEVAALWRQRAMPPKKYRN